jgi:hypothetical protein
LFVIFLGTEMQQAQLIQHWINCIINLTNWNPMLYTWTKIHLWYIQVCACVYTQLYVDFHELCVSICDHMRINVTLHLWRGSALCNLLGDRHHTVI